MSSAQKEGEAALTAYQQAQSCTNTLPPGTACAMLNAPTANKRCSYRQTHRTSKAGGFGQQGDKLQHRVTLFVQPVKAETCPAAWQGSNASQQSGPKDSWQQRHHGRKAEVLWKVCLSWQPVLCCLQGLTHHDDVPVVDHRQLKQCHCTQREKTHTGNCLIHPGLLYSDF